MKTKNIALGLILGAMMIGLGEAKPDPRDLSTWIWNDPTPLEGVDHGD